MRTDSGAVRTLGAVVGFMVWTWISVIILLGGAELNAEMEQQTARDYDRTAKTDGAMGRRHGRYRGKSRWRLATLSYPF